MNFKSVLDTTKQMDETDPLREFRDRFYIPKAKSGRHKIYFCGNSLGLQPKEVEKLLEEELEDWKSQAVDAHLQAKRPWLSYHEQVTTKLAKVVGAKPIEVVAMNSLTVNLHLMMVSFYAPAEGRHKILMEDKAFPSDRYAVESQIRFHDFDPHSSLIEVKARPNENCIRTEDIQKIIEEQGDDLALILLSGVQYYTGQAFEMEAITRLAQQKGIRVGFDLAHAVGNIPLELHQWDVDFAVWCSYKYLNSGPGAIAGCFVHERHARNTALKRFAGWWGHNKQKRFLMEPIFDPLPGAESWQLSNPPILSTTPLLASLGIFEEAGMKRLREKSIQLTAYLEFLIHSKLENEIDILTPQDPKQRGCQLSLQLKQKERGSEVYQQLLLKEVVCDWREPNVIRIAPTPLYNKYLEVFEFVQILKEALHR